MFFRQLLVGSLLSILCIFDLECLTFGHQGKPLTQQCQKTSERHIPVHELLLAVQKCAMPSSLLLNSELFSAYKNHTSLKGLEGISPSGVITFISQLYTGSMSDREIVERAGILNEGDSVMADKGFTVSDILHVPLGVSLNIPTFLGTSTQMPQEDVVELRRLHDCGSTLNGQLIKLKIFIYGIALSH